MTAPSLAQCRIQIRRRTARWDDGPVAASDGLDFWGGAASAANVIMQLSWPGIGHGVLESKVDSGNLFKHPWKRACVPPRSILRWPSWATTTTVRPSARRVDGVHRQVQSGPDSPVQYNAFDRDLQMWVAACLFVGLEDIYGCCAAR